VPKSLCIESKSLKLYLFAFRNHNTFHEDAVNRILDDLVSVAKPRQMRIEGVFNPRGGISINVATEYKAGDATE
jgi:7-cyano-7-deazaguanine reductase